MGLSWIEGVKSAGGGLAAFAAYLSVSTCFDTVLPAQYANAIGISAGMALNFTLQRRAFGAILASCRGGTKATLMRYVMAEALIVCSQQSLFVLGLDSLNLQANTNLKLALDTGSRELPSHTGLTESVRDQEIRRSLKSLAVDLPAASSCPFVGVFDITALRIATQSFVFIALSFPIRKRWVFARKAF